MDREQEQFFENEYEDRAPAAQGDMDQQDGAQGAYETDDDHTYLMKLLDYLQAALEEGSVVPLTGKRLVDTGMCLDILKDIRGNLPLAIQYAEQVMRDRNHMLMDADRVADGKIATAENHASATVQAADQRAKEIIDEAENRADNIVKTAETHARGLVDQHNIKIIAQNEARDIVNDARAEANDRRQAAAAYCEDMHHNTEKALQRALEVVKGHRQQLSDNR